MKLMVVSHTEHYQRADGTIVGWGPTVTELNHLASHFEKIYHVATLHSETPPPSALPYTESHIEFVPIPPSGGTTFLEKLKILLKLPKTLFTINKTLCKADVFQLRTPTGIGVYTIPYLSYFVSKKGWYKYAGNWNQKNPPLGYRLQRAMLKRQHRTVTINGSWPDQPSHCITFENPCLTLDERNEGTKVIASKKYEAPFTFCFVGRLDDAKGVQRIIDSFSSLSTFSSIDSIHFIGNGERLEEYKKQCSSNKIPAVFHGFLPRKHVFDIYRKSHFLLLPSTASEGFPKVIAEAMNFGCLPIVSDVSSIGQYINTTNGYIVSPTNAHVLTQILREITSVPPSVLKKKATKGYTIASKFTFAYYNNRIINEILSTSKT